MGLQIPINASDAASAALHRRLLAKHRLQQVLLSLSHTNDIEQISDSESDDDALDDDYQLMTTPNTKLAEKIAAVPKNHKLKCKSVPWSLVFSLLFLGCVIVVAILALTIRLSLASSADFSNTKSLAHAASGLVRASSSSTTCSSSDVYPTNVNEGSGSCTSCTAWTGGQWVCNAAYLAPPNYTPDQGWYYSTWPYTTEGGGSGYYTSNGSEVSVSGIRCNESAWTDWTFVQGEPSPPICMIISSQTSEYKTTWRPGVDDFTVVQLQSSENRTEWYDCSTVIAMELGNITSGPRTRFDSSSCKLLVPFWTIVIHLDGGKVTEIAWDDTCTSCGDSCVDGNCGVTFDNCIEQGGKTDCSIKVYISWTGTDSNGNTMLSSNLRLSQFEQFSFSSAWDAATNWGDLTLSSLDTPDESSSITRPETA